MNDFALLHEEFALLAASSLMMAVFSFVIDLLQVITDDVIRASMITIRFKALDALSEIKLGSDSLVCFEIDSEVRSPRRRLTLLSHSENKPGNILGVFPAQRRVWHGSVWQKQERDDRFGADRFPCRD